MLKKIIDYALGFVIATLLAMLLMLLILLVTKVLMGDMNGL